MKKLLALLFFMSLTFSASAQNAVPGDVIVVLRNDSGFRINSAQTAGGVKSLSAVKSFAASQNVRVLETFDALSDTGNKIFMVVHSDTEDENTLLRKVRSNPNVIAASLNYRYTLNLPEASEVPDDPEYHRLWGMEAINAPGAWTLSTGSEDVYVIVMDSGVDYNHPDLKDNFSHKYSRNFVGHTESGYDPSAYYDENEHGTHCAGTIAGVGNNALGVAGVNWKAKIISLRVLDENGSGSGADVMEALSYLAGLLRDNPSLNIAAVNYSLGDYDDESPESIIKNNSPLWLVLKNISDTDRLVLCIAAGNEALDLSRPTPSTSYYNGSREWLKGSYERPGSYLGLDNMITVAAANQALERASFSNYSRKYVDIAAPGYNIYSTLPVSISQDKGYAVLPMIYPYGNMSGTSMAAPHVTGAATLLRSIFPKATASQIKAALLGGANGDRLRDDGTSAYGLLDLAGAINFMAGIMSQDMPPVITDVNIPDGGIYQRYKAEFYASGTQPITWTLDGDLPEGLSFDEKGRISGTPTESGAFPFTVTASNDYGTSSLVLTLSIDKAVAPVLDKSTLSYDILVTSADCFVTMMTSAGTWPMTWILGSRDIPSDFKFAFNPESGVFVITPRKAGTYTFPVTVSNDAGSDSGVFTLTVRAVKAPEIDYTSGELFSPAVLGRPYASYRVTTSAGNYMHSVSNSVSAKGTRPISWDVQGLPKGLRFALDDPEDKCATSTIRISGKPEESGDFTLRITATNAVGVSSRDIPFKVEDNKPVFVEEGMMFSQNGLEADTEFVYPAVVEGSAPITFTISGDLPDGTNIRYENNTAIFYGKPTKTGHYTFTITAKNSCGEDSATFDFYVREPSAITTNVLPDAVAGVSYDAKISLRSDVPVAWKVSADKSLNIEISPSGHLTWLPEKAGSYKIDVTARLSPDIGEDSEKTYTLIVREAPAITTSRLPDGKISTAYTSTVLSADGTAPVTWSFSEGKLPGGLTLSQNGHLYGTPKESGSFVFTLKAQNKAGHDTKTFTLNIAGVSPVNSDSPDVIPVPVNPNVTPNVQPDSGHKTVVITEGKTRDVSSLTIGELASISSSGGMIAAILPEISTNESAFYTPESIDCFVNVKISDDVPTGWTLVWNAFTHGKVDALSLNDAEDDNVLFTDSDGNITLTVPENHIVNISAWLDAYTVYAPVLSAVENHESSEGIGSSSGGCNAGLSLLALTLCAVIFRKYSR